MYAFASRQLSTLAFHCSMWGMTALASAMVAAHFFGTGPYWHDAGWFSYLLDANPGLTNPDGSTFYTTHVSPLLSVLSGLNCIVRAPRPMPMVTVLVGSFLVIVTASYRIFSAAPSVAAAMLLSTIFMSRQVFEFFRYPHYEILGLALFMPLWIAVTQNRLLPAIASLTLLLMVREDMGLHVGLLFLATWAGLRAAGRKGDSGNQATPPLLFRLSVVSLVYSVLAFCVQYLMSLRTGSMIEKAIIGSGEQISMVNVVGNLCSAVYNERLELALVLSLLAFSPTAVSPLHRLLLLAPYGLWSAVCAVSQNPAMAKQGSYYSFPLFFVLVVSVAFAVREWNSFKGWARACILLLATLLLGSRMLDLRQHELQLCASAFSPSMRTFENVGTWQKVSGMDFGSDVMLSHACASLWVTPTSVTRTIHLDSLAALPEKPLLLMEHEHGADRFFRMCLLAAGQAYSLNGSSFILWIPEKWRGFLDTLPYAAGATPLNIFTRTLIVVPPATRIDGDVAIARAQSGCCFYGPYVTLPAGRYRIHGKAEPPAAVDFVRFDCAAEGNISIASHTDWNGNEFIVDVSIESDARNFEFRGWSNNPPTAIRLDDISFAKAQADVQPTGPATEP